MAPFLRAVRGHLSAERVAVVENAFRALDSHGDGFLHKVGQDAVTRALVQHSCFDSTLIPR